MVIAVTVESQRARQGAVGERERERERERTRVSCIKIYTSRCMHIILTVNLCSESHTSSHTAAKELGVAMRSERD